MERIGDIKIDRSHFCRPLVVLVQDDDLIVVYDDQIEEFIAAIRKHTAAAEEPEPTPEKWYVVLDNSNQRLTNFDNTPTTFISYSAAYKYARGFGGEEWTHCPISVDEYEREFGR